MQPGEGIATKQRDCSRLLTESKAVVGIKATNTEVLEVCTWIAFIVARSQVEHKEAKQNMEETLFHGSIVFQPLKLGKSHKDCILDFKGCQYFFSPGL